MQEARFAGACQDQHAGRLAPSLGWPGERKSIGATNREKAIQPRLQGLGPGLPGAWPRAWGRGLQSGLPKQPSFFCTKIPAKRRRGGFGAPRSLGPRAWGRGLQGLGHHSLGGRQAKGWEKAETAAAQGARHTPPTPPPGPPPPLGVSGL